MKIRNILTHQSKAAPLFSAFLLLFSFSFRLSHHAFADAPSNGGWIQVGSLAHRRVLHTATLLQDGRVLVAAGTSSGDSTTTVEPLIGNAEVYDPTSRTWSITGALNTLRRNNSHMFPFMVTLQNGKALIAGGSDANNNSLSSAELYDSTTGTWSYTGSLNTPRRDMSMILLNDGRALIAAGTSGPDSTTSLASAELYNPMTGIWSYTANTLAVPRDGPTMVKLHDGRVLLAGGNQPDYTCTNLAEIFDPITNTWSSAGTMPFGGVGVTMTVLTDGSVFVTRGDCGSYTATSAIYDPAANTWTPTTNVPVTPIVGNFLLKNGNVLIRSGSPDAGTNPGTIPPVDEVYNPTTNSWTTTNLPLAYDNEFASYTQLANGDVLTAGGWKCNSDNPSCTLNIAELFTTVNTPPVVNPISVPATVGLNTSITASANFTDPNTQDTHTAQWNWGDGNTTTGTVTESNGSGSVSNSHTYTFLGAYTITLTVTDNGGLSGTSQTVIAVIPANGLAGRNLTGLTYSGANLSNQNISGSNLQNATFNNTNFQGSNLSGVNAPNASFQNANFTGANLVGSTFQGANFTSANLTGANLKGANLKDATMTGVIWSNTICPDGTNSNNDNNTCTGHGGGL